jgi:hypothetical protein
MSYHKSRAPVEMTFKKWCSAMIEDILDRIQSYPGDQRIFYEEEIFRSIAIWEEEYPLPQLIDALLISFIIVNLQNFSLSRFQDVMTNGESKKNAIEVLQKIRVQIFACHD